MVKASSLGVLFVVLVCAGSAAAAPYDIAAQRAAAAEANVVPGELIVQFRRDVTRAEADRAVAARGARVLDRIAGAPVAVVKLPPGMSVRAGVAQFAADARVALAEPNYVLRTRAAAAPDDTYFGVQWALENTAQLHPLTDHATTTSSGTDDADVDALDAWGLTMGSADTVIAIVDVAVDLDHPDLAPNIWTNGGEIAGNGLDDDGNGYADDVNGWDFVGDDNDPRQPLGSGDDHGTFVASVAAAATNNTAGVAGMCAACRIMSLRVHTLAHWIEALYYAKANGAHVVNMSIGDYWYSQAERNAIAAGQNSFLLVVAADNFSLDNDMALAADVNSDGNPDAYSPAYPGVYTLPNILHVAATTHTDEYAYDTYCDMVNPKYVCAFTNWGHDSVDVAAPGVDMYGAYPADTYDLSNGTSFSAPLAAGIAGLLKSLHPEYTPVQLRNAIMNSVDKPAALGTMYASSGYFGSATGKFTRTNGRVNAAKALNPLTSTATLYKTTDGNVNGSRKMKKATVSGSVRWPDDVNDVWRKYLKKGAVYRVKLDGKNGQDFDLWGWRTGTKEIFQDFGGCSSCKLIAARTTTGYYNVETFKFKAKASGNHFFQVAAWIRKSGSYSLSIRRL